MNKTIREIREQEYPLLKDFLYEAIFIPEGAEAPPKAIVNAPELQVYVCGFGGQEADFALVAEVDGKVIGAVWARIMEDYGHVDAQTPSLAIALFNAYRGLGIGTELMRAMLSTLAERGFGQASLSVQKANYAVKLYKSLGFEVVEENDEEYIMVKELSGKLNELIANIDKLHTTEMGAARVKRNLSLDADDVMQWCRARIQDEDAAMERKGKNWYVRIGGCEITVNAHSYTVITAHKIKKKRTGQNKGPRGRNMDKKAIVKYFYETVVSKNLLEELPDYISENCTLKAGETIIPLGLEGMRQHLIDVRKTYPDYTMRIIKQYEDGDYVISEFVMEGTHEGEWLGIKPTHKKLSITGVDIDRVSGGKIVEHGGAANTFETLYENEMIKPV